MANSRTTRRALHRLSQASSYTKESRLSSTTWPAHLDETRNGHDWRLGSTGGIHGSRGGFIRTFQANANYAISASLPAGLNQVAGATSWDYRFAIAPRVWANTNTQRLFDTLSGSTGVRVDISAAGKLEMNWGRNGGSTNKATTNAMSTYSPDGTLVIVMVRFTAPVAGGETIGFYYKTTTAALVELDTRSDASWTFIENATQTGQALVQGIGANVALLGNAATSNCFEGKFYCAVVKDGANVEQLVVSPADISTFNTGLTQITGKSANALVFTLMPASGAIDSSDPQCVTNLGRTTLYTPGVSGNNVQAAAGIGSVFNGMTTGTFDLIAGYYDMQASRPAATECFIGGGGTNDIFSFSMLAAGTLQLSVKQTTGGTNVTAVSTVALPNALADLLYKVHYDFGTSLAKFYTAPYVHDYTLALWTQLGADVPLTIAGGTSATSFAPLVACARSTAGANNPTGHMSRTVAIQNATIVWDVDYTDLTKYDSTHGNITAIVGGACALNAAASGKKRFVCNRNGCDFGTSSYADMYDVPAGITYPFTLGAILRARGTPTGSMVAMGNTTTANNQAKLRLNAGVPELVATNGATTDTIASSGGALSGGVDWIAWAVFESATSRKLYVAAAGSPPTLVGSSVVSVPMPTIDSITAGATRDGSTTPTTFLDYISFANAFHQRALTYDDMYHQSIELNAA